MTNLILGVRLLLDRCIDTCRERGVEWVGVMVFLGLPMLVLDYITHDIIHIRPGFEDVINCAIYFGLLWLEIKAYQRLVDKAYKYFHPGD